MTTPGAMHKIVRTLAPYCRDGSHQCCHIASSRTLLPFFPWRYEVCTCSCHGDCPAGRLRGESDDSIHALRVCCPDDT